jgi:hypothetical protein
MAQVFGNNLSTALTAPITALDTNLPIVIASGDDFPQVRTADDDFFLLTLVGLTGLNETSWEVIKVTDIGSNNLAVVERGQEGTTAQTWPSGTRIEMRLTAGISTRHEEAYGWGDHSINDYATNAYVDSEISTTLTYIDNEVAGIVNSAPGTLDTLQELASALGDDPNFATTVATSIGTKWTEDATKIANWDAAYSYGDHGAQNYQVADADGSALTNVKASEIYVEESSDDNNYYEVLFAGRENGGDSYMTPQVDYDSITFNPSANRLDVDNIRVWEDLRVDDALNVGDPSSISYPMTLINEDGTANLTFNIKTSPTGRPRIAFGDTDDSDIGWIRYDNVDDSYDIRAGNYTIMHWRANGDLEVHGNCEVDGTISASGYNDDNWNTAYSWGNHADAGYSTGGSALERVAFGAIAEGDLLVRNPDDTVSAFSGANTLTLPGANTPSELSIEAAVSDPDVAYDPVNNVYVAVAARTSSGGLNLLFARVGTVSGDSISWGAESLIDVSPGSYSTLSVTTVPGGKVVVCYPDAANNNYATAKVGTISGTTISFGNAQALTTSGCSGVRAVWQDLAAPYGSGLIVVANTLDFDFEVERFTISYIGQVSGSSISFNGGSTVPTRTVETSSAKLFIEPVSGVLVYIYKSTDNNRLYAAQGVALTANNLATWPSEVAIGPTFAGMNAFGVAWDTSNRKFWITFDYGNKLYSASMVISGVTPGVVTNPELSLDLDSEATQITQIKTAYNPVDDTFGAYYKTSGAVDFLSEGTSTGTNLNIASVKIDISSTWSGKEYAPTRMLWEVNTSSYLLLGLDVNNNASGRSSAVTAGLKFELGSFNANVDNFFGVASGDYSNGENAQVVIDGSVSGGHSGLTYGDFYYANLDGGLASTPISGPAVPANLNMPAGRAISETEILLELGKTITPVTTFSETPTFASGADITGTLNVGAGANIGADLKVEGNIEASSLNASRYNETFVEVTSLSNVTTIDGEAGNVFSHTLTEGTTFVFSNPPNTGTAYGFTLKVKQSNNGGYPVVWQNTVNWPAGIAPTLTDINNGIDVFTFFTHNGGADWYGFVAGANLQ